MTFDLRIERWLHVRRNDGTTAWVAPYELTHDIDKNPIIELDLPRPDFEGAMLEFLIGLLTTAFQLESEEEWLQWWRTVPSPEILRKKLQELPNAFDLDGDETRFLQDTSPKDFEKADVTPIEQLLVDAPGDQTIRLNKDLFIKRNRVESLGRPAAAMALITLQTYAPAGGKGHRTSLRGGGPLTTLVDPRPSVLDRNHFVEISLWKKIWANVETQDQWTRRAPKHIDASAKNIFPWLARTRISDPKQGGKPTTALDGHPLQCYFGMPRRIRLEFGYVGTCDVTGRPDERTVTGFRMVSYGIQYTNWQHPLSPYYFAKGSNEWLPVHGQPGGVGWNDWLGLALKEPTPQAYQAAGTIAAFSQGRARRVGANTFRIHVFGYDFDNMKARDWVEANLPALAIENDEHLRLVYDIVSRLTEATSLVASVLHTAVRRALFAEPDEAPGDTTYIKTELWDGTTHVFNRTLDRLRDVHLEPPTVATLCHEFHEVLQVEATKIFDQTCAADSTTPEVLRRLVAARFGLVMVLRGKSKLGDKLFANLGIASPDGEQNKKPRAKSKKMSQSPSLITS